MTTFQVYLWTKLPIFQVLVAISILGIVSIFSCILFSTTEEGSFFPKCKSVLIGLAITLFFSILVPTKEDAALMYVLPRIVNNEEIPKEAGELYNLAKKALQNYVEKEAK